MNYKTPDLAKKRLQLSSNLRNLYSEENLSEHTVSMITHILSDNEPLGTEHRCQTIVQITNIIETNKTEEDFLQHLNAKFPKQYKRN